MADPLKQICDELGVCTEEALFYLEGFRWDLNAATEACRSKTLPSSENERTAAEEQRRNDKIARFVVATGATVKEARYYLSRENWNVDNACLSFLALSHDDHTEGSSNEPWYLHGFSGNERPDTTHDVLSKVPQFHNTSTNLRIGSPPPSARTPPLELKPESIKRFRDVVSDASSQAVIDCLNDCKGNAEHAIQYFYENETPPESLPDEIKEERIASFSSMTGETRHVAKVYLEKFMWNLDQAIDYFFEPSDPSETQKSLEVAGEGDVTVAIPGMASSQVDGKAVEEGSSTETVPDPFANRDRRTTVETQAAPSTITLTINLADTSGASLELPFRSNQTLRDIRNAIDQRYPDNDRGYVLQSGDGVDYMDWNVTLAAPKRCRIDLDAAELGSCEKQKGIAELCDNSTLAFAANLNVAESKKRLAESDRVADSVFVVPTEKEMGSELQRMDSETRCSKGSKDKEEAKCVSQSQSDFECNWKFKKRL
ncbi:hypothetical protein Bca4012_029703 [Brassica carinata]